MTERTLLERTLDAIDRTQPGTEGRRLAISTALTLARREGFVASVGSDEADQAALCFPLPTHAVRRLRKEPDPEPSGKDQGWQYRWNQCAQFDLSEGSLGMIEHRRGDGEWEVAAMWPTDKRIALWYDLMQRPYHEESVPVDPAEVLP